MEHLINSAVKSIQVSGIRKFYNRVAEFPDAISLTLGMPDFATPEHVREAAKDAIDAGRTTYTPNAGIPALREAIAHFQQEAYGLSYSPSTEILVTNGASHAIDIILRTVLEPGCEVILPAPVYPGYEPLVRLCGATPVFINTVNTNFELTAEDLLAHFTPRTRLVILPYPSNPTGCVLSEQTLTELAGVLGEQDVFILSDEIYSELRYDEGHMSIASLPGMRERTIVVNGLSKSHSMTGWRIGYTLAPDWLTRHMVKVLQYSATCASSISQFAALEALTNGALDPLPMREEYRERRDFVLLRLSQMGIPVVKPEGAFYVFPDIRQFGLSSFTFATKFLEEAEVAIVPGDAFSTYGEGFARISYAASMESLREALERMEKFISRL